MAELTATDRVMVWANLVRRIAVDEGVDVTDPVVRDAIKAAVDAADTWADTNQASYVSALPEPFATWSTAQQKAMILAYVLLHRYDVA